LAPCNEAADSGHPMGTWQLGDGGTEVIEWSRLIPDRTVMIDDQAGRRAARVLALQVTGTLGILALAATKPGGF